MYLYIFFFFLSASWEDDEKDGVGNTAAWSKNDKTSGWIWSRKGTFIKGETAAIGGK